MGKQATLGLINPKTPTNVGTILRACGCFNVDNVYYTGERYHRAAQYQPDTKGMENKINIEQVTDIIAAAPQGATIICVDLIEGAIPLHMFEHPENAYYIFGPEDGTIGQDVIDQCHQAIYIATEGCLNLAASANVVLYDRSVKTHQFSASDELIKSSRDTNNRVKFKI
ncbi:RNA methyltransferase [Paraferrimonas sp. SM1919]|uniref:RNA methyltransferase n=1 Tax=Paraferrimonas sp. SM1919 TaxID=2662263 RepID=UPI0013D67C1F|nr:RNA methyltransferase [Paraferrimonas sp. SM1919]